MATKKLMNCISDGDYILQASVQSAAIVAEGVLWTAVYTAGMAAKRKAAAEIAEMEAKLNKRRLALAKKLADHAAKGNNAMGTVINMAINEPEYTPLYGPAQAMLIEGANRENEARNLTAFTLHKYGISENQCDVSRVLRGMAIGRTDFVSHSMRAGEARSVALNDRRRSRQNAATGLGRGGGAIPPIPVGTGAISSMSSVVNSIANTFNSGMALWGYMSNRNSPGGNFVTGKNELSPVLPSYVVRTDTSAPEQNNPVEFDFSGVDFNSNGYAVAGPAEG